MQKFTVLFVTCCLTLTCVGFAVGQNVLKKKSPSVKITPLSESGDLGAVKMKTPATTETPKQGLVYGLTLPPPNFKPPLLSIPEPIHNWGTVLQGEVVTHAFVIENKGGMPLRIDRVRASCGCTTVDYDKEIPPNGQGKVSLRVDTQRFSGSTKKTAQIYSNAGRDATTITIQGNIDSPVEFDPKLPRIQVVRGVEPEPTVVTVKRTSNRKLVFKGVAVEKAKENLLKVVMEETVPGQECLLKITPTVSDDAGPYHYVEISLQTDVDGKPFNLPVRVSMTLKNRIEATPSSVYFHNRMTSKLRQEDSESISRDVEIKTLDPNHTFKVTGVKVLGSTYETRVDTVEEGKHYRLVVTLPKLPDGSSRRVTEKIVISTDDATVPEITINATANFAYGSSVATPPTPRMPVQPLPNGVRTTSPQPFRSYRGPENSATNTPPRPVPSPSPAVKK